MTKFFKNKSKLKEIPTPEPRVLEEITKEYNQVTAQTGQLQYQMYIYERELTTLNNTLIRLNQEAAARLELDKKVEPKQEVKSEEVK